MKMVQVVKNDGSIHVLPEDIAEQLIKSKEAKPYADKMVKKAPKTKGFFKKDKPKE